MQPSRLPDLPESDVLRMWPPRGAGVGQRSSRQPLQLPLSRASGSRELPHSLFNSRAGRTAGTEHNRNPHRSQRAEHRWTHMLGHDSRHLMLTQEAHDVRVVGAVSADVMRYVPPNVVFLPTLDNAAGRNLRHGDPSGLAEPRIHRLVLGDRDKNDHPVSIGGNVQLSRYRLSGRSHPGPGHQRRTGRCRKRQPIALLETRKADTAANREHCAGLP